MIISSKIVTNNTSWIRPTSRYYVITIEMKFQLAVVTFSKQRFEPGLQ